MRISLPATAIAVLGLLASGAQADEVKYKSRSQPQSQSQERQAQSQYKQPRDTPRERPPDKYHPVKEPPDRRPPDDNNPPDPPQPPPRGGWYDDPWFPPRCPDPYDPIIPVPMPGIDVSPPPEIAVLREGLSRRLRLMQSEGFAGQVVVGWYGQVYFERAFGSGWRTHDPAAVDGYYDIGSATKTFTAWAIYELIGSRKLTLATTLDELFANVPSDKRHISIEQLLGNTSGLGNTYAADGETDRSEAVSNLLAQPLLHAPGQMFSDSDDGYVILAAAIEVASGMAYESYLMDSGVVGPAMKNTLFWGSVGSQEEHWGQRGSGGIISTAHDLHAFASSFLDSRDFIVEEITRARTVTDDGMGVGYGWFWTDSGSNEAVMWTSGTGQLDHNVMLVVYPAGAILVVASDRFHGDVPWSERVANTLEPMLLHADAPEPVQNTSLIRRH